MFEFLTQVGIFAALTLIAAEFVTKLTKVSGFAAQFQSWVVAILIGYVAGLLGFGFPNATLFTNIIYGILVGLVANGVFSISAVQNLLMKVMRTS